MVTSTDLVNGQVVPRRRGPRGPGWRWYAGIMMLIVGAAGWLLGAGYSVDGWTGGANLLASWLTLPVVVPTPVSWPRLVAIAVLGILYSCCELYVRPSRAEDWGGNVAIVVLMVVIHGSDIGSTYLGVVAPRPGSWPIAMWVASVPPVALVWSLVLTYLPELLLLKGWAYLTGRPTTRGAYDGSHDAD